MFGDKRILAVVPARSGSKGIPDKNMRTINGTTLIGWAGLTLAQVSLIDRRVISTDSARYAAEGERHGLSAPFLRPERLASDRAGAVETLQHAVLAMEEHDGARYDVILIVEPTSPLRLPADIDRTIRHLGRSGADSVVTVSVVPAKFHPHKVLTLDDDRLEYFSPEGASVVSRQTLKPLYWRNGVCYAVTRRCLVDEGKIIGANTRAVVIDHPAISIDDPWELDWAATQVALGALGSIETTGVAPDC